MLASGVAGYACMDILHESRMEERKRIYTEAYHRNGEQSQNNGNGRLVALARKMTHRLASSSGHVSISDLADSSGLQRQVTKMW
jgi:hypothetical protein